MRCELNALATILALAALAAACNGRMAAIQNTRMFESARTDAERGDLKAAVWLGSLYLRGIGTERSVDKALYWYERGGAAGGWSVLGRLFHYGRVVPADHTKAAAYYRKAVDQCETLTLYGLGALEAEGLIAESDPVEAYKWLILSRWAAERTAGCGTHKACIDEPIRDKPGHRRRLEGSLSADQLAEARRRADEWIRRHPWKRGNRWCDVRPEP